MKRGRASKKIENSRKDFTSEVASLANLAHASMLKTFGRGQIYPLVRFAVIKNPVIINAATKKELRQNKNFPASPNT